ncbi:hypothetical protein BX285_1243 [Streptomyces sp. 1114.5]|uniref:hypothetical protein n=1 Tax=Streptomyces sp. 1114.5 TaxID=1938830 RepID=UPI000EAE0090|nr:hypothetical protein [Streptomyces sp. 1114.5]RKT16887.1 hypothetical protein BX285_1243 [Streptomyces sp. 1114.5]
MSTTSDLIATAVLIGPGALLSIPVLASQRGTHADSTVIRRALAASAAERAARTTATTDPAPPDGGEGAPAPADTAPAARLAAVIALPEERMRRAA